MGAAEDGRAGADLRVAGGTAAPEMPAPSPSRLGQLGVDMAPTCSIRILGPLEVGSSTTPVALGGPKQRSLFAILVVHANEIVATDRLIELVWGEAGPRTAGHSIQIYVSELRKALASLPAPPSIITRPPGYVLDVVPDEVDALRFERLAREGAHLVKDGREAQAITVLQDALALWRGAPLSDFAYEEFAQAHIQRWHGLRLDALEDLAHVQLVAGQVQEAMRDAEAAIGDDPLRERAQALRFRALYASGRHVAALRSYEEYRRWLADELGLVPSPALQRLHERILLHDPELSALAIERTATSATVRNPYKGLRAFREVDAGDFFGRETLVDQIISRLRDGAPLIALVGPSGSGKSSVLAGGLIPRLKAGAIAGSDGWLIASTVLGARPLEEVEAAIARAAGELDDDRPLPEADELAGRARSALWRTAEHGRVLLVLDQFEELFLAAEESAQRRFLDWLVPAVTEPGGPLTAVVAMRADHYDRPLLHAEFAELFSAGVLNVVPMTAFELETAVVQPAARAGVDVQPTLLAQLLADSADQPGSLPLLQYALTEQFERAEGTSLTVEGYHALGGLRAVLARRAEAVYDGLTPEEQQIALQILLRMVRLGEGTPDARRRVLVGELASLDIDAVGLSEVLDRFGAHRLVSFDRDTISGAPTVEVAHEALLSEWTRLAGWIERHRFSLRRVQSIQHAAFDWEESGRAPDYLLTGSRLAELETWSREAAVPLTADERAFLAAGLAKQRQELAADESRAKAQRRLRRRARIGLAAVGVALALVAASVAYVVASGGDDQPKKVALVYYGHGELGNLILNGFLANAPRLGLRTLVQDISQNVPAKLDELSAGGYGLIIDHTIDGEVAGVALRHPSTHYVLLDRPSSKLPNLASYGFAAGEGSYLAGVAAALKTTTRTVGFIGGVDEALTWQFAAGYEAGVRSVDPTIRIVSVYLSRSDYNAGFENPQLGGEAGTAMYQGGADVIFAAAGTSSFGVFQAAFTQSALTGRQLWAIGSDSDQYNTTLGLHVPGVMMDWSANILTSVVKRYDRAMAQILEEHARGTFTAGDHVLDLANGGVDLAVSGGFISDVFPQVVAARAQLISGQVHVPCLPSDRQAQDAEAAYCPRAAR